MFLLCGFTDDLPDMVNLERSLLSSLHVHVDVAPLFVMCTFPWTL